MTDRDTMMKEIAETGFLLDDLRLYLDTHPLDGDALNLYGEYSRKRRTLLDEYAGRFEPLACGCLCPESSGSAVKHRAWCGGPFPWEAEASGWAAETAAGNAAGQPQNSGSANVQSQTAAAAGGSMKGGR